MKKWAISLLFLICLTGCGASEEIERGMALRSSLLRSSGSFDAHIIADYGEKCQDFSTHCIFDDSGNLSFTVAKPDEITGITGNIQNSTGALTFDDTVLYFDLLTDDQLSPVSAPWIFLKTLRSGYLTAAGEEGDLLRLTIDDSYEEDALHLDIWLDQTDVPVRAEILYDGRRILSIEVDNFQFS